jgi:hypothetical protein
MNKPASLPFGGRRFGRINATRHPEWIEIRLRCRPVHDRLIVDPFDDGFAVAADERTLSRFRDHLDPFRTSVSRLMQQR